MMTTQSYDCWATQAAFYTRQESFQSDDDSLGQFAHHSSDASHASQQEIRQMPTTRKSCGHEPMSFGSARCTSFFCFFFWNSPLITPVQLDPTGGVVGINCLFVCCQVPIPPTPVSGSCYLPLGALQLMWATCCKIQWQSWYICWLNIPV